MFWDTVKGHELADAMYWYFRNNTEEWEEYSILIENEPLSEIHKLLQNFRSASLGVGSPDGWLWAITMLAALDSRAFWNASLGWTMEQSIVPCDTSRTLTDLYFVSNDRRNTYSSVNASMWNTSRSILHMSCGLFNVSSG